MLPEIPPAATTTFSASDSEALAVSAFIHALTAGYAPVLQIQRTNRLPKLDLQVLPMRMIFKMMHDAINKAVARAPNHMKPWNRIPRRVEPALHPMHHRKELHRTLREPVIDFLQRVMDIILHPPPGPNIARIEFRRVDPIRQRQFRRVLNARALLVRRADHRHPAEGFLGQPSEPRGLIPIENQDPTVRIQQFQRRHEPRKPATNDQHIGLISDTHAVR